LEEKPDLFEEFTRDSRKEIEENPESLYRELTPDIIIKKMKPFLEGHLKSVQK
jgi:heptosyltransferase-2